MEPRLSFRLHDKHKDFLHVSAHILSGRSDEQKSEMSNAVLAPLKTMGLSSRSVFVDIVDIHRRSFMDFSN